MAVLKVDNNEMAAAFFEDSHLLGIQCTMPPARFVWLVNASLHFDFRFLQYNEVKMHELTSIVKFPVYSYSETHMQLEHTLYTNVYQGAYLLPELKYTDFVWMLKGHSFQPDFFTLLERELKALPGIQLVSWLQPAKIKNKLNLLL